MNRFLLALSIILYAGVFVLSNAQPATSKTSARIDSMLQYYHAEKLHNGSTEYRHNNWAWDWLGVSGLYVTVSEHGRLDLIACYREEDRFHLSRIGLKIGHDTTKTKSVAEKDNAYKFEDFNTEGVREVIRYANAEKLIEKILASYNTEIDVIFYGAEDVSKVDLYLENKQAIRDSYELAKAIKLVKHIKE